MYVYVAASGVAVAALALSIVNTCLIVILAVLLYKTFTTFNQNKVVKLSSAPMTPVN